MTEVPSHCDVLDLHVQDVPDHRIELNGRWLHWYTGLLDLRLLDVVRVDVCITRGVDEFLPDHVELMCEHVGQQRIEDQIIR